MVMADAGQVLVVDDEPDILESLQILLHEVMGLDVLAATSGNAALPMLTKAGPDLRLIVSDYRMPGMDGLEFLATAAKLRPEVPRMLITAYAETQLAVEALNRARVARFMAKPLDPARFKDTIRQLMADSKAEQQRRGAFDRTLGSLRKDGPS